MMEQTETEQEYIESLKKTVNELRAGLAESETKRTDLQTQLNEMTERMTKQTESERKQSELMKHTVHELKLELTDSAQIRGGLKRRLDNVGGALREERKLHTEGG